jgi:hypothetical protein
MSYGYSFAFLYLLFFRVFSLTISTNKEIKVKKQCDYRNSGHYALFRPLFKTLTFQTLDSVSVFRWNVLRWAQ